MTTETDNDSLAAPISDFFDQFFTMTNYEFVAGRYPTQAGEILCEDEFLSLNGYYFDRDGVSDSELKDYFRSLSNVLLVDNASEVRDAKSIWFRTMVPVYFMGACLLVFLLVNVYIALNSSYEENRSQLAMLSALGVNERGLISLQLRLNRSVFFRSAVLGNAFAAGACYAVFRFLIEYDTYAEFLPPCGIMIVTTALVTAVFLGVSMVMRKKIRSMNMVEELSAEAS